MSGNPNKDQGGVHGKGHDCWTSVIDLTLAAIYPQFLSEAQ